MLSKIQEYLKSEQAKTLAKEVVSNIVIVGATTLVIAAAKAGVHAVANKISESQNVAAAE